MYRIAMVAACPFPQPRGTPTRILRMSEALAQRGHEVHVVTYHLGGTLEAVPFYVHRTESLASYHRLSPGPSLQKLLVLDLLLARKLAAILDRHEFDVIHGHHYEGLLVSLYARRWEGLPVVYDAHTLLETELPSYRLGLPKSFVRALGRQLDLALPRRADHVVAVADNIESVLVRDGGVPADRVDVVSSGVEPERFDVAPDERPHVARGVRHLIFTGNLAPYQGIDLLLRAFQRARARDPHLRLLIVSEDTFAPYRPLARELGLEEVLEIVRVGFDQVPAYLAAADVAVNPRVRCDGTPQKLLNYMAAGKPIVSFQGSGGVLEHGTTGWLVPGADVAAFAAGVLHLLEHPELGSTMGDAARRRVAERFGWDRTAQQVEAVYHRVLARRPRATG